MMASKYENDLAEKRTHENATIASPASDGPPREHYASNEKKETDHIDDPANSQRMGDPEDTVNTLCKSTRDTQKQAFVHEDDTTTDPSSPSVEFDAIDPLSKFPYSHERIF